MSTASVKWRKKYGPVQGLRLGTLGVGVTAEHFTADGKNIVTKLTMTGDAVMPAVTGTLSVGLLIWTFPAGVHSLKVARIAVGLTQAGSLVGADTPEVGLGDTIGSGANSALSSVAASENILLGQAANNVTGTVEDKTIVSPSAGNIVNEAAGRKAVYLNIADGWAGADAGIVPSGSVWLEWTMLS